jgi:transcriptional regulator with XRE-family HTH domain
MTTSAENFQLSSPTGEQRVSPSVLSYFEGRNRYKVFDLVWDEFRASGLTQAALAKRLGMSPSQLNRMLKSPGNWTLDTVSNLLFAVRGGEPKYGIRYPLDEAASNEWEPEWIEQYANSNVRFESDQLAESSSSSSRSLFRITKKLEQV